MSTVVLKVFCYSEAGRLVDGLFAAAPRGI